MGGTTRTGKGRKITPRSAQEKRSLKARFVAEIGKTGLVLQAAHLLGIGRATVYGWRNDDPVFAEAWDEAIAFSNESLEAEARRRGQVGVLKPVFHNGLIVGEIQEFSDQLLMFVMKAQIPAKYRDTQRLEHTGKDGGPIEFTGVKDRLAGHLARLAARAAAGGAAEPTQ